MHSSHEPSRKFAQSENTHLPPLHYPTHPELGLNRPSSLQAPDGLSGSCDSRLRDVHGQSERAEIPIPNTQSPTSSEQSATRTVGSPTGDAVDVEHHHLNGSPQQTQPSYISVGPKSIKMLKSVRRRRDKVITKRQVVDIHRRNFLEQDRHLEEAQRNFFEIASGVVAKLDHPESGSKDLVALRKAWEAVQSYRSLLSADKEKLLKANDDLNQQEEVLLKQEKKLYQSFPKIEHHLSLSTNVSDDSLSYSTSNDSDRHSSHRGSNAGIAPLVDEYYDKVSQTDYLRDNWLNFRADHQRQRALRERSRELGDPVQPSEFSFLQSFYQERKAKLQEYESSQQEMWNLFQECKEKGYSVDEPGIPPLPDDSFFEEPSGFPNHIVQRTVSSPLDQTFTGMTSPSAMVDDPSVEDKVSLWLDEQHSPFGSILGPLDFKDRFDSMEACGAWAAHTPQRTDTDHGGQGCLGGSYAQL
jgi:hypothetical protein